MSLKDFTTQDLLKELAHRITHKFDFTGYLQFNYYMGGGTTVVENKTHKL